MSPSLKDLLDDLRARIDELRMPGEMRLLPFRPSDMPSRWYMMNGAMYASSSPQGLALLSFSALFRLDWGIVERNSTVNVPLWFDTETGRGWFARAVDGVSRQIGSVEQDAMRRIKGQSGLRCFVYHSGYTIRYYPTEPPFNIKEVISPNTVNHGSGSSDADEIRLEFDSQLSLPDNTADETRALNVGLSPCIYLGV